MGSKNFESVGRVRQWGRREQGKGDGSYSSDLALILKKAKEWFSIQTGLNNGAV